MTLRFTPPPEEPKGFPRYASYVVGLGIKTHSRVTDAKNSFRSRGFTRYETDEVIGKNHDNSPRYKTFYGAKHSFILENVNGTWYVLYEIPEKTLSSDLPWMKTFIKDTKYTGGGVLRLDVFEKYEYNKKLREAEPERFRLFKKAVPMTQDEYVEWRLAVQREQIEEKRSES